MSSVTRILVYLHASPSNRSKDKCMANRAQHLVSVVLVVACINQLATQRLDHADSNSRTQVEVVVLSVADTDEEDQEVDDGYHSCQ